MEKKKSLGAAGCAVYKKCGGCQLQNMEYSRQLKWKQGKVENYLGTFGKVLPIIGMDKPTHYRNKVQAAFAPDRTGRIISGVYQSSTRSIVQIDKCMIEDATADRIIVTIRSLMKSFKIFPYNERTRTGLLRHVLVRRGFSSGQIMVVLVTASPILPAKNQFVKALLEKHPEITTIIHNVCNKSVSMLLGESEKVLYGPGNIEDTLCGCVFRISAKSFYQVNPIQTEILYTKAVALAGLTGKETVIDAYCGIGTIGLIASRNAKAVIGVEYNHDAVRDAAINAVRNSALNVKFFKADAGEFMKEMAEHGEKADVVFMDPPRAGSNVKFLEALTKLLPTRIVYISCNPETQQRDLKYLLSHGYQVCEIQPLDMFPHTNHVETCVLLSHKNS